MTSQANAKVEAGDDAVQRRSRTALDALLRPRSIAIVGASIRAGSFGERLLNSINGGRYRGAVYPINPRYEEIGGRRCFPSLKALPEPADCVAFAVSDDLVEAALAEAADAGVLGAVLFGRGYEPPGRVGPSRVQRLSAIARGAGMAVCGNNCMGFFNTVDGIKMSGNPPPLPETSGTVGLVSHSGSTWSGLIGNQRDLIFNYAVSAGQEIATTMADYIEFLLAQPETRVVACLLETVRAPERFLAAIEKADRQGIPVVVLKLGRTERGRRFALAHSGALAGSDAAYGAIFERHNVIRVDTPDELTDTVELLKSPRRPGVGGVGIVTDSGGERELIVDLATDMGAPLAEVQPVTKERLAGILDPGMEPQNPVDSYGDGRMLMEECLGALADDPGVAVVALATNLVHGRPYARASSATIERAFAATAKPALVFGNIHSSVSREEATRLRALGVPVLMGTATALTAIRNLIAWQHARDAAREKPPALPPRAVLDEARALIKAKSAHATEQALPLPVALRLLELFGIPSSPSAFTADAAATEVAAERLGFPVVLKTAAPEILHKTEAGGVALGLTDRAAVVDAYARIAAACGALVQVQGQAAPGAEVLLGMTNDPQFGPMVTVGLGGIFTEIFADAVTFQPPVGAVTARSYLERLKGYKLLQGYRGRPKADLDALAVAIERFSLLCATIGSLFSAIDLNPVIAGASGALTVDALFLPLRNP
ncbi:MAG TPA: acetate--CoA ligase family protein [Stellaceae bacterium]|nr:acetate--CoA ligase family protein [Stellaceae bacterium]